MSSFKLYSVNWQDGMLLNERHLLEQERYLEEVARWHGSPSGDGFGLVRRGFEAQPGLELKTAMAGGQARVDVVRCQALTSDGYIISIDADSGEVVQASSEAASDNLPVYISVQPAERLATGAPDPSEEVPRMPYRSGNYTLHLGERPSAPEGQVLQVARLRARDGQLVADETYFPPCVSTYADHRLDQKTADLRNRLESLLSIGNRAHQTISAGDKTDLQRDLLSFVAHFVMHLSSTLDTFQTGKHGRSPLTMVIFFKRLFRVFGSLLKLQPGVKDYVHEKYFVKEAGSDVSRFVVDVENFVLAEYNHEDIGGHVTAIEGILEQVKGVLSYLAQVKGDQLGDQAVATDSLAYSGKTYMIAPHSGTRVEQAGELVYLEIDLEEPRPMKDNVILLGKSLVSPTEWSSMHVRLGINDARGLGETDPVAVDAVTYGDKVALHPHDMLQSASVRKMTLIFRGVSDASAFSSLGKMDLFVYSV
ncbi:hypothetical protein GF377_10250 [candidate division GN15 bacterium]|nr:hypothetical protein [candidate division GN15 bacterium]